MAFVNPLGIYLHCEFVLSCFVPKSQFLIVPQHLPNSQHLLVGSPQEWRKMGWRNILGKVYIYSAHLRWNGEQFYSMWPVLQYCLQQRYIFPLNHTTHVHWAQVFMLSKSLKQGHWEPVSQDSYKIFPKMETPPFPLATLPALSHPQSKKLFLGLQREPPTVSCCAHCFWYCLWKMMLMLLQDRS